MTTMEREETPLEKTGTRNEEQRIEQMIKEMEERLMQRMRTLESRINQIIRDERQNQLNNRRDRDPDDSEIPDAKRYSTMLRDSYKEMDEKLEEIRQMDSENDRRRSREINTKEK